jgi:flavin-dependent dehydrogenase
MSTYSAVSSTRQRGTALVIGGSIAGLFAARALAEHFGQVFVIERDEVGDAPGPRRGAPQARHQHVLLKRGRLIAEQFFPGLTDELIAAGAPLVDMAGDFEWLTPAGWAVRFASELLMVTCSRDLLEWTIRRRLASHAPVCSQGGVVATGLVPSEDGSGVAGVVVRDRDARFERQLRTDLVVDASGRGSRLPHWLESLGYRRPEETVVTSHLGYASRLYRRDPDEWRDSQGVYVQPAPPRFTRGGVALPLEGGRWHVTLAGGSRDYPPTNPEGFVEFARSLRSSRLYDVIASAEALSPVYGHRATENRMRHYERMRRWPSGLVVLGDASCAFNPVYAQGMTTAALAAMALDGSLREARLTRSSFDAGGFQRRLARVYSGAWMLATGEDCRFDGVEGASRTFGTRMMHRYMDRVVRLTTERADVRQVLLEVFHMVRPPHALFHPRVLIPALRAIPQPAP